MSLHQVRLRYSVEFPFTSLGPVTVLEERPGSGGSTGPGSENEGEDIGTGSRRRRGKETR